MNIEYEIRVLEVNAEEIVKKLERNGAIKVGEWFQKRYVYDFNPKRENEWIRLRTNGNETSLTYKKIEKDTIDGTKELEIQVESFEDTNSMLNILGYNPKAYQENKRVRYILDNVEIDIDTWPQIPSYLEIEGKDEKEVNNIIEKLNVDKSKLTALNCQDIYKKIYNIDISKTDFLRF